LTPVAGHKEKREGKSPPQGRKNEELNGLVQKTLPSFPPPCSDNGQSVSDDIK